jgi:hypothetical protein
MMELILQKEIKKIGIKRKRKKPTIKKKNPPGSGTIEFQSLV